MSHSDSEDSLYVPPSPQCGSLDLPLSGAAANSDLTVGISSHNRAAIDDIWREINGATNGSVDRSVAVGGKKSRKVIKKTKKASKKSRRIKKICDSKSGAMEALKMVFGGGREARDAIRDVGRRAGGDCEGEVKGGGSVDKGGSVGGGGSGIDVSSSSSSVVAAGNFVSSSQVACVSTGNNSTAQPVVVGVDAALRGLTSKKVTTIQKTSNDWDALKSSMCAADVLKMETAGRGKEGYLGKEEFKDRVDGRRFEIERGRREAERDRRGKM